MMQSSAVITRSNWSRYYFWHCGDSSRTKSDFKLATDTPYLALTGELWGVYCEDLWENRPRYNDTALYPPLFADVRDSLVQSLACCVCYKMSLHALERIPEARFVHFCCCIWWHQAITWPIDILWTNPLWCLVAFTMVISQGMLKIILSP